MRRAALGVGLWLCTATAAVAAADHFTTLAVVVDAGEHALAAYQVEVDLGGAMVVGVEGGDGPFAEPPFYDPAALRGGRIVLAAFTTDPAAPRGPTRVARLHVWQSGARNVIGRARLRVAATTHGDAVEVIPATVTVIPEGPRE